MNIFPEECGEPYEIIKSVFRAAAESTLVGPKALYVNKKEYHKAILESKGYRGLSDYEISRMAQNIDVFDIVHCIANCSEVCHLLIAIDNIDENPGYAISIGKRFVVDLERCLETYNNLRSCILITLREYNINRFSDTQRHAPNNLPIISESEVIKAHLELLRNEIEKAAAKKYEQEVPYESKRGDYVSRYGINYVLSKKRICDFLKELSEYLLSEKEPQMLNFIRNISAGNLKFLVGNMYNFFHSVNLPLTPLFYRKFMAKDSIEARKMKAIVPLDLLYECLMTIHYPFYDVKSSFIINVFNACDSKKTNDYENTLVIPRILSYITNMDGVTYKGLKEKFNSCGYSRRCLKAGIDKCLFYGLVETSEGNETEHLKQDTRIVASTAAAIYMNELIYNPSYLQYACEDTPMPEILCVPVEEKYNMGEFRGAKENRMSSVRKMLLFIEQEELKEKRRIVHTLKMNAEEYLFEMGIRTDGKGVWISSKFDGVVRKIDRIMSE